MNRIAIIGLSGSGKSTFANKLSKKLNRPVIHLDKEYWTSEWEKRYKSFDDWKDFQRGLVKQNSWIIDGDYSKSRHIRLDRADTIIFFDKPEGIKEKIDWALIKHILSYSKNKARKSVEAYRKKCQIFTVRNNREINHLLDQLSGYKK